MLVERVVQMLLEDFRITENYVRKIKHVNDAYDKENHLNGGIKCSNCDRSVEEENDFQSFITHGIVTFIFLVRVFDKVSCYLKEHSFRVN